MTKKQFIIRTSLVVLAVLAVCTVLSTQIFRLLLPVVELAPVESKLIGRNIYTTATLDYISRTPIVADESWYVQGTDLAPGKSVNEGDVLFTIDMAEADITRAQLELSIMQIEAQLSAGSSATTDKKQLELELSIAEEELSRFLETHPENGIIYAPASGGLGPIPVAEGKKVSAGMHLCTINSIKYTAEADWVIEEHLVEPGSFVEKGAPLFRVSVKEYSLSIDRLRIAVLAAESRLSPVAVDSGARESLRAQLEIAKARLVLHDETYPEGGEIRSSISGTVAEWNISADSRLSKGQVVGYIAPSSAERMLKWTVSSGAGEKVNASTQVRYTTASGLSALANVYSSYWDAENSCYVVYSRIPPALSGVSATERITAESNVNAERYDLVVPASCVFKDGDYYYVYTIIEKEGLFRTEQIVARVNLQEVLLTNGTDTAITFVTEDMRRYREVVRYSTAALYDGMVVKLGTEP